jgi:class 3 adenylate cyclase
MAWRGVGPSSIGRILGGMPNLPSGTVTFAFSDIENSTGLLKQLGDEAYGEVLRAHRRLVRETFALHEGQEIDTQGDAFFYSFPRAREAVRAAIAVQRAHDSEMWPNGVSVRIRLGLHTGEPAVGDEGYTGLDVVRASRIAAIARGGQVLLSDTTRALAAGDLPEGVTLAPIGERRLRGIDRPEPIHELRIPDVRVSREGVNTDDTSADLAVPARAFPRMADWIRGVPPAVQPMIDRANELIEARVLAEVEASLREDSVTDTGPRRSRAGRRSRSLADEIAKLRELHESGALTDEQYARAVDRMMDAGEG